VRVDECLPEALREVEELDDWSALRPMRDWADAGLEPGREHGEGATSHLVLNLASDMLEIVMGRHSVASSSFARDAATDRRASRRSSSSVSCFLY
jgi:hypothetical protein